jgi:hypothetical protein
VVVSGENCVIANKRKFINAGLELQTWPRFVSIDIEHVRLQLVVTINRVKVNGRVPVEVCPDTVVAVTK